VLSHVVYTRDATGKATIYLDGALVSTTNVAGNTSNWDEGYRLALANELTKDRPWLGELYRVGIYSRSFTRREVETSYSAGLRKTFSGAEVLYDFREGKGNIVRDVSGNGKPLNLKIENPRAVQWRRGRSLAVRAPVLIASTAPGERVSRAVKKSNAITIEAWIKPANTTQDGPARIVTVSRDPGSRNFTLGQKGGAYEVRFRTTSTSPNGEPALSSPGADDAATRICGLRSKESDLAVIYLPTGGEIKMKPGALKENWKAVWFNPRNGQRTKAERREQGVFHAPDEQDWVLLFN
jgi:hypothetical protein